MVKMGTVFKRDEVILLLEAEMWVLNNVVNTFYVKSMLFYPPCNNASI